MTENLNKTLIQELFGELIGTLQSRHPDTPFVPPQGTASSPRITEQMVAALSAYVDLIVAWTPRVDLVSERDSRSMVERHIIDAIAAWMLVWALVGRNTMGSVLDVGSGAGLPGVVWAILDPTRHVALCEPREKRAIFLKEVRRVVALPNVAILPKRVEEVTTTDVSELAIVTSRALGDEELLLREAKRLLNEKGWCALMVGSNWQPCPTEQFPKPVHCSYTLPRLAQELGVALWKFD